MVASSYDPLRVPAEFWQRDDVAQALAQRDIGHLFRLLRRYLGASQTRIGIAVGLSQGAVSPIMNGNQEVIAITVLERIADGLDIPDDGRRQLGLASKEEDPMKRRTALSLGLLGALSPEAVTTVLRESAAEAMDFTASTMSSVSAGTLDHLEAVVLELDHSYNLRPASELLPIARAYRHRVEQLLGGKHTVAEVRELYVRAANLSDLLSDLAHDFGSYMTAVAWAIDSDRHAELAGHNEASGWARGMISACSLNAGRPGKAIAAAERGLSTAPRHSPIAARLYARAARGYACVGNRTACTERLTEARKLCDQLPDESPSRFTTESQAFTHPRSAGTPPTAISSWPTMRPRSGKLETPSPSKHIHLERRTSHASTSPSHWPISALPRKPSSTAVRRSPSPASSAVYYHEPVNSTPCSPSGIPPNPPPRNSMSSMSGSPAVP